MRQTWKSQRTGKNFLVQDWSVGLPKELNYLAAKWLTQFPKSKQNCIPDHHIKWMMWGAFGYSSRGEKKLRINSMKDCHGFSQGTVGSHSLEVFMNRLDRHLLGMKWVRFILSPGKGVANITSGGLFESYFLGCYTPQMENGKTLPKQYSSLAAVLWKGEQGTEILQGPNWMSFTWYCYSIAQWILFHALLEKSQNTTTADRFKIFLLWIPWKLRFFFFFSFLFPFPWKGNSFSLFKDTQRQAHISKQCINPALICPPPDITP